MTLAEQSHDNRQEFATKGFLQSIYRLVEALIIGFINLYHSF